MAQLFGSHVRIRMNDGNLTHLAEIRTFLHDTFGSDGPVTGVTYRPMPFGLNSNKQGTLLSQTLESPGRFRTGPTTGISPVPPNFFEVLDTRFLKVSRHTDNARRYSISGDLYTAEARSTLLVSTSTFNYLGLDGLLDSPAVLRNALVANHNTNAATRQRIPVAVIGAVDATPVLTSSKYPSTLGALMGSLPTVARFSGDPQQSVQALPITRVFVRVSEESDRDMVAKALTLWDHTVIRDVRTIDQQNEGIKSAGDLLNLFFVFAEIIIMVICFFSLLSSMSSNVMESSKEIAILLCMGMTHFQVYRVYILEAFILLLSSGILGLIAGLIVAYTMMMQNVLLTQLPLSFPFPWMQLVVIAGAGVVSAVVASVSPVAYLLSLPSVTHILRRTV